MNVADLLHDAPSTQRRPPTREQQPPQQQSQQPQPPPQQPQHRERSRERERQTSGHSQLPSPHPHLHPSQSYHGHNSRSSRQASPPRSFPPDYPGNHPQAQRLPPPSAILPEYDLKPRRQEHEPLPSLSHEMSLRQQHGQQSSMGPPGPLPHPYEHRPPGPPSRSSSQSSHSHSHQHSHSHGHSGGPSPMYMPPPNSRNSVSSSKLGSSPPGPGMPPTGHGSIPLFPTPVGPGMGHPHLEGHSRGPPGGFNEQSPMYNGPLPGTGPLSRHPPSQGHLAPPNEQRHRRGSSGHSSQATSPAMSSLQRPPYDERDAGRGPPMGPPSQFGGGMGPAHASAGRPDHRSSSTMSSRGAPPQMLTGPGAAGMHAEPMTPKERDRHYRERDREREREREKERESQSRSIERRERERAEVAAAREREREMFEAERNEREKAHRWEREQRREEEKRAREQRRESHDFMSGMLGGGDRMSEAEREREWMMRNPHLSNMGRMEQPNWSRFAQPREDPREREQREMERQMEREREREMLRRREEEMRAREQMDAERMNRQVSRREREREAREKERIRDVAAKDANRERTEKSRRTQGEDHGWLPDPRAPAAEGWIKDAERERERQLQMRFQQEREREFHEREFAREREREEMEAMRNRHPASHHHHHLHHHHHRHPAPPSSIPGHPPGHIVSTKSKMGRQIELQDGIIGPGAGLPAPFDKVVTTLPPPPGHKHSKTPIATTPSQPLPPQMMPEHFHPSNHLLMPPTRPPLGFQDFRPTSPPFKNALTAPRPNIPMQSRSPRPPLMPTLKPRTLGTFVHPRLPFPFLDFPMPSGAEETREIHASLLIPSGFIPVAKPRHPRIWGGALIPSFSPFFANPLLMTHAQAGMPYGFARPLPHEIHGVRRVYTDDSDMFLCALHAGWITWSIARKARAEGKDLRLEVRLSRESRYPGGLGSKFMGAVDGQEVSREDDGSTLLSAGWGNSHDGAGVEILHAEFVKAGTARKLGLRNRSQRISEYSERASSLGCMSAVRKRRRVDPVSDDDIEEYDLAGAPDADVCASRTVVLGYRRGSSKVGFKYNCEVVKRILFPAEEPPRKKAKLSDANALQMDVDDEPAPASRVSHKGPSIVVETLAETFLIHPQEDSPGSEDKENADGGLRYTISLVHVTQPPPPSPEKAVDTESTPDQATATQSAQHADAAAEPSVPASDEKGPAPATTEAAPKEAEVFTNAQLPVESKPDEAPAAPDASSSDPAPAAIAGPNPEPPKTVDGEAKSVDGAADAPKEGDEPTKDQPVESDKAAPTESKATPAESQPPEAKPVEPAKEQSAAAEEDVSMADATSEPAPSKTPLTTLEVLQRNAAQADLLFDDDGISVLSNQVENGMRKGWKLEARSWRWASAELTAIAS